MSKVARQRAKQIGNATELATVAELTRQGAMCVQRIATPSIQCGDKKIYTAQVVGDIVGIWPSGRGILVECKTRKRGNAFVRPTASCFEDHQRDALIAWDKCGGSALVAYLFSDNVKTVLLIEPATNFMR